MHGRHSIQATNITRETGHVLCVVLDVDVSVLFFPNLCKAIAIAMAIAIAIAISQNTLQHRILHFATHTDDVHQWDGSLVP